MPIVPIQTWEKLSDDELMQLRICDLGLTIENSPLAATVEKLYQELAANQLSFRPQCYLGDEWFCPDKFPIISIPFYLAHPRLAQLELKLMLEVEGDENGSCIRLLRHECGHAINYAYRLFQRKKWRELFGPFSAPYEDTYKPRPYSKQYVRHLSDWYAQYHPDEDFAETFAVWLAPNSDWKNHYANWGALKKLEYVDGLPRSLQGKIPPVTEIKKICDASKMTSKLSTYYERKRKRLAYDFPDFYDGDLRKIFREPFYPEKAPTAKQFLARHRRFILESVARWTGEPKFIINRLLMSLSHRCHELELRFTGDERALAIEVVSYLTVLTMNYRQTGRFVRVP